MEKNTKTITNPRSLEIYLRKIPDSLEETAAALSKDGSITVIESPYAGNKDALPYLWACCRHALSLGEIPFASHGFYTQFLDDNHPKHRNLGISCGYFFYRHASQIAFYCDLGMSSGMSAALRYIQEHEYFTVDIRFLGDGWRGWLKDGNI